MFKDFKSEIKVFPLVAVIAVVVSVSGILLLKALQSEQISRVPQPSPTPTLPPEVPIAREVYFADIVQEYCRIFGEVTESMKNRPRFMRLENLPVEIDPEVAAKIVPSREGITPRKDYPIVCSQNYEDKYYLSIEGDNFTHLRIATAFAPNQAKKVIKESGDGSIAIVYDNVGTDAPPSEFIFAYGEKNFNLNRDETLYITFSLRLIDENDSQFAEMKKTIINKNTPLFNDSLYNQLSQNKPEKDKLAFVEEVLKGITEKSNFLDQTQVVDTSTWQTYRNDEFGFEVKYPPDLSGFEEVSSDRRFGYGGLQFFPGLYPLGSHCASYQSCRSSQNPDVRATSFIFEGRIFFVTDEGVVSDSCQPESGGIETQKEIGGVMFTRGEFPGTGAQAGGIRYLAKHQGICYRLSYINYGGSYVEAGKQRWDDWRWKELKEISTTFEEMISTFRFIPYLAEGSGSGFVDAVDTEEIKRYIQLYIGNSEGYGIEYIRFVGEVNQIEDIDKDGTNEYFLEASGWGGTCVGGTNYAIIYAPNNKEYFIASHTFLDLLDSGEGTFCTVINANLNWKGCGEGYVEYNCYSNNLGKKKIQHSKNI